MRLPTLLLLTFLTTWASAQVLTITPLDPWVFWSLKADTVLDAKAATMPIDTIGAPKAPKKREGSGYKREYERATLYTEAGADNAHAVNGDILTRYIALGGAAGVLGHPTSDWTPSDDNRNGWFNTFRNGAIYWTWTTGAHEVHGQIYTRWMQLGGHRSWLGYPVTGVQAGDATSGAERISAFEKGFITYNTNGNGATATLSFRDILVAKYYAVGGPKSKLGLPVDRNMPFFLDGLGAARMAFRGGSVWVPLSTTQAAAQWQIQIKVRLLGVENMSPPPGSGASRVSGALAVFVPSTRAFGNILKMSGWWFTAGARVSTSLYPDYGGNVNNVLYDGPPAELMFVTQHVEVRSSDAAAVANWIAAALGLDIIGRVAEADGMGNPPIDVDKAFGGEAYTWPFRIGTTTNNMYGQTDWVYPSGRLRLHHELVMQHSQIRGLCISANPLSSTNCPTNQRISTTITVPGPAGGFATYKYHFQIEQWQVWVYL